MRKRFNELLAIAVGASFVLFSLDPTAALIEASAQQPNDSASAGSGDMQFVAFPVKHLTAHSVVAGIRELLPTEFKQLKISIVDFNNSFIAGGPREILTKVGEMVKVIDRPNDRKVIETPYIPGSVFRERPMYERPALGSGWEDLLDKTEDPARMLWEVESIEVEIHKLAAEVREQIGHLEEDDPKLRSQSQKLRKLVNRGFLVRQRAQQQALEQLRRRTKLIEDRLREREELQEEIVNRRVEGLLTDPIPSGGLD